MFGGIALFDAVPVFQIGAVEGFEAVETVHGGDHVGAVGRVPGEICGERQSLLARIFLVESDDYIINVHVDPGPVGLGHVGLGVYCVVLPRARVCIFQLS